jgi:phage terminase small subunit
MALTPKQERFVQEYLIDLNTTQAAIRAGYSEKTAHSVGHETLKKPEVAQAIAEAQSQRAARTGVTADMVVRELARIGFSDLRKVLSQNGSLLNPGEWDDDTAASIASIEVVTNSGNSGEDEDGRKIVEHVHKIKVWDKNSALEKLAKHLGMFTEKHEHTGPNGGPIETRTTHTVDPKDIESALAKLKGL